MIGFVLRSLRPTDHRTDEKEPVFEADEEEETEVPVADLKNDPRVSIVYDRLIELYRSRERNDWKNLIGLSTKWAELAEGVFER